MDMASAPVVSSMALPLGEEGREEWYMLADAAVEPNPFYHPAILEPALRHLHGNAQVKTIEAWDDAGRLIGLLPLIAKKNHGRYPLANTANWMHGQCFYGAPLIRKGHELRAWDGILCQLDEADWAGLFLHLDGLDAEGPVANALEQYCALGDRAIRRIATHERAMLCSGLDPDAYWQKHVRAKKRKELRRLVNRLEEVGTVTHRSLASGDDVGQWTEDFLALEMMGWKGKEGTALASSAETCAYVCEVTARTAANGMLDMLRIDLDDAPVAMLVNFRMGGGVFSYKIAFDERFARFSPGVLIEMDNMRAALSDPGLDWSDSCAVPNHPMIDGLWAERRMIAQYRVQLKGRGVGAIKRHTAFALIDMADAGLRQFKRNRE